MKRVTGWVLVAVFVALGAGIAAAEDAAGVDGSNTTYRTKVESTVGDKKVTMALTGTAMRKKAIFKVYTIGSYVESGTKADSAEDLANADCPKQLHIIMERDVDGKEMADAFATAIRAAHAAPAFSDELKSLTETMRGMNVRKGDHVWLTHVPKKGLKCTVGKKEFNIDNVDFAKAVWGIYLGKTNISDVIKKGLVSRL